MHLDLTVKYSGGFCNFLFTTIPLDGLVTFSNPQVAIRVRGNVKAAPDEGTVDILA